MAEWLGYRCTYPFFFRFFSHVDYYGILSRVPCAIYSGSLMLYFYIQQCVYVNPKLLIDLSSCLSPLVTIKLVFKVCFCSVDKYICVIFFLIFHIEMVSYGAYLSLLFSEVLIEVCLSLQCLWVILESFSPSSECVNPCVSPGRKSLSNNPEILSLPITHFDYNIHCSARSASWHVLVFVYN